MLTRFLSLPTLITDYGSGLFPITFMQFFIPVSLVSIFHALIYCYLGQGMSDIYHAYTHSEGSMIYSVLKQIILIIFTAATVAYIVNLSKRIMEEIKKDVGIISEINEKKDEEAHKLLEDQIVKSKGSIEENQIHSRLTNDQQQIIVSLPILINANNN